MATMHYAKPKRSRSPKSKQGVRSRKAVQRSRDMAGSALLAPVVRDVETRAYRRTLREDAAQAGVDALHAYIMAGSAERAVYDKSTARISLTKALQRATYRVTGNDGIERREALPAALVDAFADGAMGARGVHVSIHAPALMGLSTLHKAAPIVGRWREARAALRNADNVDAVRKAARAYVKAQHALDALPAVGTGAIRGIAQACAERASDWARMACNPTDSWGVASEWQTVDSLDRIAALPDSGDGSAIDNLDALLSATQPTGMGMAAFCAPTDWSAAHAFVASLSRSERDAVHASAIGGNGAPLSNRHAVALDKAYKRIAAHGQRERERREYMAALAAHGVAEDADGVPPALPYANRHAAPMTAHDGALVRLLLVERGRSLTRGYGGRRTAPVMACCVLAGVAALPVKPRVMPLEHQGAEVRQRDYTATVMAEAGRSRAARMMALEDAAHEVRRSMRDGRLADGGLRYRQRAALAALQREIDGAAFLTDAERAPYEALTVDVDALMPSRDAERVAQVRERARPYLERALARLAASKADVDSALAWVATLPRGARRDAELRRIQADTARIARAEAALQTDGAPRVEAPAPVDGRGADAVYRGLSGQPLQRTR